MFIHYNIEIWWDMRLTETLIILLKRFEIYLQITGTMFTTIPQKLDIAIFTQPTCPLIWLPSLQPPFDPKNRRLRKPNGHTQVGVGGTCKNRQLLVGNNNVDQLSSSCMSMSICEGFGSIIFLKAEVGRNFWREDTDSDLRRFFRREKKKHDKQNAFAMS